MNHRWTITLFLLAIFMTGNTQNAPVTSLADYCNLQPGEVIIPVTVSAYNQIGAGSLTLEYDPAVLNFIEGIKNPAITGFFGAGDNPVPSGMRRIMIGWFGNALSLPDGSALLTLRFTFLGGTTNLTWIDDGSSCEYTDGQYNALNDAPMPLYYQHGLATDHKCLNVEMCLEGLYDATNHRMISVVGAAPGPGYDGVADSVKVELHQQDDYAEVLFESQKKEVSTSGKCRVLVPPTLSDSYYLTVKHRNSIATVSALPLQFSAPVIHYNFTDEAEKAFYANMIQMADGKWAFYAGDVNQDGSVDTADMSPVDNDANIFAGGYLVTDINGDGMVDTGDMTIVDNNAAVFAGSFTP